MFGELASRGFYEPSNATMKIAGRCAYHELGVNELIQTALTVSKWRRCMSKTDGNAVTTISFDWAFPYLNIYID